MAILIDETKRVFPRSRREKPMRRIDPVKHGYDGRAPQKVKE